MATVLQIMVKFTMKSVYLFLLRRIASYA